MRTFRSQLADRLPSSRTPRRWIYVPYDQLSGDIGPLARWEPPDCGIILVESPWKARRRPYHKRKLALVLANMRHFALEQAERGVDVRYVVHDGPYREALARVIDVVGPIVCMEPAERELRKDLEPLVSSGTLAFENHEGWLTSRSDFEALGRPPWRMDRFYRNVRKRLGVLMDGNEPVGGAWSFDRDNRKPWKGTPPAPTPPTFAIDAIKLEVGELIETRFAHHPGTLQLETLPATSDDASRALDHAMEHCMASFGPFEDAMSIVSMELFHTRLSALINLHRVLPSRALARALELEIPIQSKEGFVRQLLGWREFVHWVHATTDGFRDLPERWSTNRRTSIGDGGWHRWQGTTWPPRETEPSPRVTDPQDIQAEEDDVVAPRFLGADRKLLPAFWSADSGMHCLDHVVRGVWEHAYGHHITRLMVLANVATLLAVDARELCDWFWVAYEDAFDWVVEPNVLGMGTYALGDLFTSKPYVSGAAYIHRMGDACTTCRYDPAKDCPITSFYWAFLDTNREKLTNNPRVTLMLAHLDKRSPATRDHDHAVREGWRTDRIADSAARSTQGRSRTGR